MPKKTSATRPDGTRLMGKWMHDEDRGFCLAFLSVVKANRVLDQVYDRNTTQEQLDEYASKKPNRQYNAHSLDHIIVRFQDNGTYEPLVRDCLGKARGYLAETARHSAETYMHGKNPDSVEYKTARAREWANSKLAVAWLDLGQYLSDSGYEADELFLR